ncbi:hypothetical protein K1719_043188 [Acacia pycnantha]|nr:hypothetical protein K1719_043188 [Acacia pycnantha]
MKQVFKKERLNGYYGNGVYVLSNFLSSLPFMFAMSSATSIITFFMVKFHPGFFILLYGCIDLFCCIAVVETAMKIIASLVPNFLMGLIIGAGYVGIMMMTSGYFRLRPDLPKVFWRYPILYINFGACGLQLQWQQSSYPSDSSSSNLKFREFSSPRLRKLYAKQTLHRIKKRPSFRKAAASLSFPSKRHHQPLRPLSPQEGLTSPIH